MLPNDYNDESYEIYQYAFEYCTGLTSVTIGSSVTSIGWYAFVGCTDLTSIIIPSSIENIGYCAFENNNNVYYLGMSEQFNNIVVSDSYNVFFYSETEPTETGFYWHYVDGKPTEWADNTSGSSI